MGVREEHRTGREWSDRIIGINPSMFSERRIYVGIGWMPIVENMVQDVVAHCVNSGLTKMEFLQIKEKFGELRVYHTGGDHYVDSRVREAELACSSVCETCGEPGELRSDLNWWATLCDVHHAERAHEQLIRKNALKHRMSNN